MNNEQEKLEDKMKSNMENIIKVYFKQFLNKFDNFSNQMKIADLILKIYQYRYDKLSNKLDSVDDILTNDNTEAKDFLEKVEKLEKLDAKLSQVEAKIHMINRKIDSTYLKLEMIEFEDNKIITNKNE